jgi:NAD(P)-dependent dehydrogenase (short-subunit alcohol dehydrogenase family)
VTQPAAWTLADVPDQRGRTVVVTGASPGGLGFHTALELARAGARVVLAGRNEGKLDATATEVARAVPEAAPQRLLVDLSSLESVRRAAERAQHLGPVHVLVNNAGVMATPQQTTPEGFDLQMATNHFGPFLFTGLLLPQLTESGDGRVVTVSSLMHRHARRAPLEDPRVRTQRYRRWRQYGESKLANLLFTFELERRLRAAEVPVRALAAHPGIAGTHLTANGQFGRSSGGLASILDATVRAVSQSAAHGAWPLLMAATADLPGGSYCGPGGPRQFSGPPRLVGSSQLARDEDAQRRLWELSEEAVGLRWP